MLLKAIEPTNQNVRRKVPTRPRRIRDHQRFAITEFTNRSGTQSWRVSGYKRDGTRIRENFFNIEAARARQHELEAEYLGTQADTAIRATKLTQEQLQLAEVAVIRLGEDWPSLVAAADHWLSHGKHTAVTESPRLDEAVAAYLEWLEASPLRDATKTNYRIRTGIFRDGVSNLRVADVGPDVIETFLDKREGTPATKDAYRRAISSFFSWCMERRRRWCVVNPCSAVRVEMPKNGEPPAILSVNECVRLMRLAEEFSDGTLVPYLSLCLFGGLRPAEAQRLKWDQINLADGEIRLEGWQTKTGRPRVAEICPTLLAWLSAYKGKSLCPTNWQAHFTALKAKLGYGTPTTEQPELKPWEPDVLRHTSISHHVRKTGRYADSAREHGNSEAVIRKHYEGRVTSEDTERFYKIRPTQRSNR